MPTDTFYGADCQLRAGVMADADTDPTMWHNLEFISLSISPARERRDRPKLGVARHNPIDPIKPIPGFLRVSASLVLDADTRQTPRWLRLLLGAPSTSGAPSLYTHVWSSGDVTQRWMALQVRTASGEVRVFRGLTLDSIAASISGEQTKDFNINVSMRGLARARVADWVAGTLTAVPAEAPVYRALFHVDAVAATNILSAAWTWGRQLAEDAFLSTAAQLSGLRPNGGDHSGQVQMRAVGATFDAIEEGDTVFAAALHMIGVATDQTLKFEHPQAMLEASPVDIPGPGLIERGWSWRGHQTTTVPAGKITAVNDVASYSAV